MGDPIRSTRDADEIATLRAENERLEQWVSDCQAGMYINCVYCGHRYGPDSEVPAAMADVLKEHIEQCPKHPMSKLKAENERLREALHDIAGGHTSQYVDAPDVMTAESPAAFQHDMWTWSQKVARSVLATTEGEKE